MTAIHEANPIPGYYKMRRGKDQPYQPVAIWRKDGMLMCRVGANMEDAHAIWTWCADNKVGKDAAKFAFANGYWQDQPPPIGHNAPPSDDPFEALKADIAAKQKQAEAWLGARPVIISENDANYAVNAQRELLALTKSADAMFTAEKAPLLAATRACDEKWRFRAAAVEVAARLRKVFERFMVAEEARQKAVAAAKHKTEVERIAAERAKKLADDPVAALTEAAPELPLAPEPVKVQAGGNIGRRAGLKDVWVGTVTDYREAALFFIEHPTLKAVVDELAQHQVRDLKDSAKIPGVSVTKERRAA